MIKRILNKLNIYKTYKIKVRNTFFKVPIFNKLGFANLNLAEPWMQDVLLKLGNESTNFLDVGVNVGQTLMRIKAEYPNVNYVGIEPNTDCVFYVNKLISENNIINSVVLPIALGNVTQLNYLYISQTDPSDSSATTIKDFRQNENRKALPIITFPFDLLKDTNFDLIKIDVEGSELEIIDSIFSKGNCSSIFICEVLPVYNQDNQVRLDRQNKIESILKENDYNIFRITKGNKVGVELISTIGIHSDMEQCDYLFVPISKSEDTKKKFA